MERRQQRYNPLADRAPKPLIKLDPTATDLDVLDFLQGRILPSAYIRTAPFSTPDYIDDRLNLLAKAHLICIPNGYNNRNALYRYRPWVVAPRGYRMLESAGRLRNFEKLGSSSFDHDYLAQVAFYSFDYAEIEIPNLKKRTLQDVIAHSGLNLEINSEVPEHHIRPDAPLFGFEYTRPDGSKRYFYIHPFEADRGTENNGKTDDRQTLEGKLDRQAAYLTSGGFRNRYGISNASAAWVFINPDRADNFLHRVKTKYPHLSNRVLVKVLPDFLHYDDFPPPTAHMVTEDWRTAMGTFNILKFLKGDDDGHAKGARAGG
jgi:hypothetical protein